MMAIKCFKYREYEECRLWVRSDRQLPPKRLPAKDLYLVQEGLVDILASIVLRIKRIFGAYRTKFIEFIDDPFVIRLVKNYSLLPHRALQCVKARINTKLV